MPVGPLVWGSGGAGQPSGIHGIYPGYGEYGHSGLGDIGIGGGGGGSGGVSLGMGSTGGPDGWASPPPWPRSLGVGGYAGLGCGARLFGGSPSPPPFEVDDGTETELLRAAFTSEVRFGEGGGVAVAVAARAMGVAEKILDGVEPEREPRGWRHGRCCRRLPSRPVSHGSGAVGGRPRQHATPAAAPIVADRTVCDSGSVLPYVKVDSISFIHQ